MDYQQVKLVKIERVHTDAQVPKYQTVGSSGMDLHSVDEVTLWSGDRRLINTGLKIDIPKNHEIQLRPRSGLAYKHGITVLNTPATIDEDYTGELKVLLINHGEKEFKVNVGDRIAQAVFMYVEKVEFYEGVVDESETRQGGFGSTGTN